MDRPTSSSNTSDRVKGYFYLAEFHGWHAASSGYRYVTYPSSGVYTLADSVRFVKQ